MALTHSYSAIKQFEDCPQRYYRQRVIKDVTDPGNEYTAHGERVHKHLELRLRGKEALPVELYQCEPLCQSVERSKGKLLVEHELVLNDKFEPTGWWEPDAWLRSKLDVLILEPPNAFIFDWKTGRRRPDPFQMELFAAQVFKHYPDINRVSCAYVWLADMTMDKEVYFREKDANWLWESILGKIRRIHQSSETGVWPARPGGLCSYCPARTSCEYAYVNPRRKG